MSTTSNAHILITSTAANQESSNEQNSTTLLDRKHLESFRFTKGITTIYYTLIDKGQTGVYVKTFREV